MGVYLKWGEFVRLVEQTGVYDDTDITGLKVDTLFKCDMSVYVSHDMLDNESSVTIHISEKKEQEDE